MTANRSKTRFNASSSSDSLSSSPPLQIYHAPHSVQGLSNPPTLECSFNLGRITLSPTMFLVWQSAAECSLLNELVPHICEPRHDTVISELTFSAGSQFAFLKVDSQEHHFTASASPRHSNPFPEPLVLNRHMLWFEPKPFMELKLADCYKLEPSFVLRSIMSVHDPSSRLSAKGPSYLFVSVKFKTFIFSVSVEIHLVFSESFDVGARVVHARSTSFQTLPFGLINVDSGTQQDSFISFVISCFSVMYYDVNQIVEDPSDLPRSLALPFVDSVPTPTAPPLMRPESAAMSQRLIRCKAYPIHQPYLRAFLQFRAYTPLPDHVLSLAVSGILVANEHLGFLTLSFELPAIVRPSVHSRMSLYTTPVSHDMLDLSSHSSWLIVRSITSPNLRHLVTPIPSESRWYSTDTCFGLNQNHLWSLNLLIVICLSHHSFSEASCLSTIRRRASVQRVHLAQSRDVVLKLPLCVYPSQVCGVCISSDFVTCAIRFQGPSYLFVSVKFNTFIFSVSVEIYLVSSESFDVGARVVHARSTSFQTLPFGLINVDSGTEQDSFVSFVISCFTVMFYDVHQIVEDPSFYYLVTIEHSSRCNRLNSF
ncbi:hypothetical protein F2Q68_00006692 [Brassica cretica]|uniref:Uncharacterized protein n=1 Tax=Brassica cretica TaxID=69181 RepID=A0A8S9JKK9_BRACR|nr:hypothetical protein F2Q68_00006692 [Brassica cretica]